LQKKKRLWTSSTNRYAHRNMVHIGLNSKMAGDFSLLSHIDMIE